MIKISEMNVYDRMDLVMSILNTTKCDFHSFDNEGQIYIKDEDFAITEELNKAWLAAYSIRKLAKEAGVKSEYFVSSGTSIEPSSR